MGVDQHNPYLAMHGDPQDLLLHVPWNLCGVGGRGGVLRNPIRGLVWLGMSYLENYGGLVSSLVAPRTCIITPMIPIINLLTKSPGP